MITKIAEENCSIWQSVALLECVTKVTPKSMFSFPCYQGFSGTSVTSTPRQWLPNQRSSAWGWSTLIRLRMLVSPQSWTIYRRHAQRLKTSRCDAHTLQWGSDVGWTVSLLMKYNCSIYMCDVTKYSTVHTMCLLALINFINELQ